MRSGCMLRITATSADVNNISCAASGDDAVLSAIARWPTRAPLDVTRPSVALTFSADLAGGVCGSRTASHAFGAMFLVRSVWPPLPVGQADSRLAPSLDLKGEVPYLSV